MDDKRILIFSNDKAFLKEVTSLLDKRGYRPDAVDTWEDAFRSHITNPFMVITIDTEDKEGINLIERLQEFVYPPNIFVVSENSNPDFIIHMMKQGVYDFLIKPLREGDYISRIEKGFHECRIRRTIELKEKDRVNNLESLLQWYKWEEGVNNKDKNARADSMFHSLKVSLNRPAGIGALISLTEIISSIAEKKENQYIIDADIFEAVIENAKMAKKTIDIFSEIDDRVVMDLNLTMISFSDFYQLAHSIIEDLKGYAKIKNNRVIINDLQQNLRLAGVYLDSEKFRKAFSEVLINAFKFSREGTNVIVIVRALGDHIDLSVMNEPDKDSEGREGVPVEFQNFVFEPFFRLTKKVQDGYNTLEIGLGLSFVEKIIKRHNGKISISNISDNSDVSRGPVLKVNLSITLPLA